jgi:hypothetical protein
MLRSLPQVTVYARPAAPSSAPREVLIDRTETVQTVVAQPRQQNFLVPTHRRNSYGVDPASRLFATDDLLCDFDIQGRPVADVTKQPPLSAVVQEHKDGHPRTPLGGPRSAVTEAERDVREKDRRDGDHCRKHASSIVLSRSRCTAQVQRRPLPSRQPAPSAAHRATWSNDQTPDGARQALVSFACARNRLVHRLDRQGPGS